MRYENEEEIIKIVETFENGTISRERWRHAEHLTVALVYLSNHDFEKALTKMREGIFNLLRAFEVDLSKEMPYHETLTVFWMRTVDVFNSAQNGASLTEKANDLIEKYDKNYPLRFYSREKLFSDEARSKFVAPDVQG